jgi:hypothetical protein
MSVEGDKVSGADREKLKRKTHLGRMRNVPTGLPLSSDMASSRVA